MIFNILKKYSHTLFLKQHLSWVVSLGISVNHSTCQKSPDEGRNTTKKVETRTPYHLSHTIHHISPHRTRVCL